MARQSIRAVLAFIVVATTATLGSPFVALASGATFAVNSTADLPDAHPGNGICDATVTHRPGPRIGRICTLRAAIQEANASGPSVIQLPTGTLTPATPLPFVTGALTIAGAGQSVTRLEGSLRQDLFSSSRLAVRDLTIESATPFIDAIRLDLARVVVGGPVEAPNLTAVDSLIENDTGTTGIRSVGITAGFLSLQSSSVRGFDRAVVLEPTPSQATLVSSTLESASSGVGIEVRSPASVTIARSSIHGFAVGLSIDSRDRQAQVVVSGSSFSANGIGITNDGAGMTATIDDTTVAGSERALELDGGRASVTNSTISGSLGMGIWALGTASVSLDHDTISNTTRPTLTGALSAGLVATQQSAVTVANSIIAGNPSGDCAGSATVVSSGHNILGPSCAFAGSNDRNVDPMLAPLADNGGPTLTQALQAGSPAIDAADAASCPPTDQRGVHRPTGGACDIGAYEFADTSDLAVTLTSVPMAARVGDTVAYTALVTNKGPDRATLVRLTDVLPPGLELISAAASQGSCAGTTTLACNVGSLANSSSATVTILAKADQASTITNDANVTAGQIDPELASNTAKATVVVSPVTVAKDGLSAHLVRARVIRTNRRSRVVATLAVNEPVSARVSLSRGNRTLRARTLRLLRGRSVVQLVLPRATTRGALLLKITLNDGHGASALLRVLLRAR